jgi:hypothetical protein
MDGIGITGRRRWLRRVLGGWVAVWGMLYCRHLLAAGQLPPGVADVRGDVRINGRRAEKGQHVAPGDEIVTGSNAQLVFVAEKDAFLVRGNSRVQFGDRAGSAMTVLRVFTGALLSVFETGRSRQLRTVTATMGIRDTGIYVEAEARRTYVCTCYGEAELIPVDDPKAAEIVRTKRHDQPRYIYAQGMPRMLEPAPVINHTDVELHMLEQLTGRKLPFELGSY